MRKCLFRNLLLNIVIIVIVCILVSRQRCASREQWQIPFTQCDKYRPGFGSSEYAIDEKHQTWRIDGLDYYERLQSKAIHATSTSAVHALPSRSGRNMENESHHTRQRNAIAATASTLTTATTSHAQPDQNLVQLKSGKHLVHSSI